MKKATITRIMGVDIPFCTPKLNLHFYIKFQKELQNRKTQKKGKIKKNQIKIRKKKKREKYHQIRSCGLNVSLDGKFGIVFQISRWEALW